MMLSPIEMMRLTGDDMMTRGFGRIINSRLAQREDGATGARPVERRALGSGRVRRGLARQRSSRNVTINNLLARDFDSDAQRTHVGAMLETTGKTFEELWRARAEATPPNVTVGRANSAPIARSCARNTPVSLRTKPADRRRKLSRDLLKGPSP